MTRNEREEAEKRGRSAPDAVVERLIERYSEYIDGKYELPEELPSVVVDLAVEVLRLRRLVGQRDQDD